MKTFMQMLQAKFDEGKFLCVGLDSDYNKLPEAAKRGSVSGSVIAFNQAIVSATKDIVCAYKPNAAFYERLGVAGWQALEYTIRHIRRVAPDVPIIFDAKRGDIGNTNDGYVVAGFGLLDADAITVAPYMGGESLKPFLDCADKGVIVLVRTSNSGAGEFQDLEVLMGHHGDTGEAYYGPLYQQVGEMF